LISSQLDPNARDSHSAKAAFTSSELKAGDGEDVAFDYRFLAAGAPGRARVGKAWYVADIHAIHDEFAQFMKLFPYEPAAPTRNQGGSGWFVLQIIPTESWIDDRNPKSTAAFVFLRVVGPPTLHPAPP